MAFREKCGDSFVIPSDSVCDYDNYFYDKQYDDCPDYYGNDDPDDYDSFPSVYGFVGPDDYELYHDLHGFDGCGIYYARGVVDAEVSHWSENRGPDASHWSDDVRHYLQKGDVILSRTGSDVSPDAFEDSVLGTIGLGGPRYGTGDAVDMDVESECRDALSAVFEDGVVCAIGSGGPRYGTGEAAETPQEMVVDSACRDTVRGTLEGDRMYMVDPRSVSGLSFKIDLLTYL